MKSHLVKTTTNRNMAANTQHQHAKELLRFFFVFMLNEVYREVQFYWITCRVNTSNTWYLGRNTHQIQIKYLEVRRFRNLTETWESIQWLSSDKYRPGRQILTTHWLSAVFCPVFVSGNISVPPSAFWQVVFISIVETLHQWRADPHHALLQQLDLPGWKTK